MTEEQVTRGSELLQSIRAFTRSRNDVERFYELTKGREIRFKLIAHDEKNCEVGTGFIMSPEHAKQVIDYLTETMAIWKTEAELELEGL